MAGLRGTAGRVKGLGLGAWISFRSLRLKVWDWRLGLSSSCGGPTCLVMAHSDVHLCPRVTTFEGCIGEGLSGGCFQTNLSN